MSARRLPTLTLTLDAMIGGGQAIGTDPSGKKCLVWGGLPGEQVVVQVTRRKSSYQEGVVTEVLSPAPDRIPVRDPDSFLSTSPWQIMTLAAEHHYKAALVEEAFELHEVVLPGAITIDSNDVWYEYRNKIEYSFWVDAGTGQLDLAFFRRGGRGKLAIDHTSLAMPSITAASRTILGGLRAMGAAGRDLKTLLIRSDQAGQVAWQLYVKTAQFDHTPLLAALPIDLATRGEVIFSNPQSPASVITDRLYRGTQTVLTDQVLDVPFRYASEGFFQVNLPMYERALEAMRPWVDPTRPVIDLYAGVGSIGLTIGGPQVTLVESNHYAVQEMQRNINALGRTGATALLAASEDVLEAITPGATIIVDPPRAGLHPAVIECIRTVVPNRIVYLSCNPVTQGRDIARLCAGYRYGIRAHQGYNFFPRTPHIEHLVVLDRLD